MLERAINSRNPLDHVEYEPARRVLEQLSSVEPDAWARAFSAAAEPYEQRARDAAAAGDQRTAAAQWRLAYGFHRAARYPAPTSPEKRRSYAKSQECFAKWHANAEPPLRRVVIPFKGRAGEGNEIPVLLRVPATAAQGPLPLIMIWGGIDSFKEERRVERYLKAGLAAMAIDMPGVGEAPLAGSEDAERLWDPIFDWVAGPEGRKAGLDADRVGVIGCSTGGYWAAKLAHTHRDRIRAAINHGGPAHHAFTRDWIYHATRGEYPFELAETLACAFGRATFEEWVAYAPKLSLLDSGLLDKPSAPLLCVNGVDDSVFPIEDHYLLLQHGSPKSARFFNGGHMGHGKGGDDVTGTLVRWITEQLRPASAGAREPVRDGV